MLVLAVVLASCVSKKKYGEMEALKAKVQGMLDKKNKELRNMRAEMAELEKQLDDCEDSRTKMRQDSARMAAVTASLNDELSDMKATCDRVKDKYKSMRTKSTEKMRELIDQLESLQGDLATREARLAEVEAKLRQRDSIVNAIQERVSNALLGFQEDGLTVEIKNGQIILTKTQ